MSGEVAACVEDCMAISDPVEKLVCSIWCARHSRTATTSLPKARPAKEYPVPG